MSQKQKIEQFIEWLEEEEKSLITAIGKESWQSEKVYFVAEINIFVKKYLKSLMDNWISVEEVEGVVDDIAKMIPNNDTLEYPVATKKIIIFNKIRTLLPQPPKEK